jgi:acetyl esterase/lipase
MDKDFGTRHFFHHLTAQGHTVMDVAYRLCPEGDKDLLVPVDTTRALYTKLVESGVPAINVVFPGTEHAFDLLFPQISPPAQSSLYDVDRFLALLLNQD